ncbi:MAG: ArsR family transcriptional regulator [Actinobacteria bacterium]|nr:ArsR family transcriptional regulator [Actinomycetota bacterium]
MRTASPRQAILRLLKERGALGAAEIADVLGTGTSAVRPHADALVSGGLVAVEVIRGSMGRPRHTYRLTAKGNETFERRYDELALAVMRGVLEFGGDDLLARIFERREEELLARYQERVRGLPFEARMRALAAILDECGYMVDLEATPEGYLVTERNCPVAQIAHQTPHACASELRFIRALAAAEVEQLEISPGGSHCQYSIRAAHGRTPVAAPAAPVASASP